MKVIVSLFVEIKRIPGTFHVFHYVGDRHATDWFRMPINFIDAVKVLEVNKFDNIKTITAEEIVLNNCECWVIIWFTSENEFVRTAEYRLT